MSEDDKKRWLTALRAMPFCRDLTGDAFETLSRGLRWTKHPRDAEIIPYRDTGTDVYFLVEGRVGVTNYSFQGRQISYEDLALGDMFGELSAIDGRHRAATVMALEPSVTGVVDQQVFRKIIRDQPGFAMAVMQRLAGMVRFLCDRVYQYGTLDIQERVRFYVLQLARDHMVGDNTAEIPNLPTHEEIGNQIIANREGVTRELGVLTQMGLIEQRKRTLLVKDVAGLDELLPEDL